MFSLHRTLLSAAAAAVTAAGSAVVAPGAAAATPPQVGSASIATAPALTPGTRARPWPGHPGRELIRYRVRAGDTASGIATKFHAWTAELLRLNRRGRHRYFFRGELIRVPVVVAAARAHGHRVGDPRHGRGTTRPTKHARSRAHSPGWTRASRSEVRRAIVRTATRHRLNPRLALAIGWQESGWRHHRVVSSAGAIGAMQVMPGTGRWIARWLGRPLRLRNLHDNVTAGVVLLRILRDQVGPKKTIAAYYQGLYAVRHYGLFRDTRRYVAAVRHHQERLRRGWNPLG